MQFFPYRQNKHNTMCWNNIMEAHFLQIFLCIAKKAQNTHHACKLRASLVFRSLHSLLCEDTFHPTWFDLTECFWQGPRQEGWVWSAGVGWWRAPTHNSMKQRSWPAANQYFIQIWNGILIAGTNAAGAAVRINSIFTPSKHCHGHHLPMPSPPTATYMCTENLDAATWYRTL